MSYTFRNGLNISALPFEGEEREFSSKVLFPLRLQKSKFSRKIHPNGGPISTDSCGQQPCPKAIAEMNFSTLPKR